MTATERFWTCIEGDLLPAAVPLEVGADRGLATVGYDYHQPTAEILTTSDCSHQRAAAAVIACHALHRELGTLSGSQTFGS